MNLQLDYSKDGLRVGLRFGTTTATVTLTAFANTREAPLATLNLSIDDARTIQSKLEHDGYQPAPPPVRRARHKPARRRK